MTGHGINHIEKVLLIAQRLGKLSANIAACWTTVRLGPMSEMGLGCVKTPLAEALTNRDFGELTVFVHLAVVGGLFCLESS